MRAQFYKVAETGKNPDGLIELKAENEEEEVFLGKAIKNGYVSIVKGKNG